MKRKGDEISTQFITKKKGGFTLHIVARNSTKSPSFDIEVDGIRYVVHSSEEVYPARYFGFYVNIKTLVPGVHLLYVRNRFDRRLFLDKFSLYSDVSQDFKEPVYYNDCDPIYDDYCQCE